MTAKKIIFLAAIVFIAGMIAGSGLGIAYSQSASQVAWEQKRSDLEKQLATVNNNYLILVREYNKLVSLGNVPPAAPAGAQVTPGPGQATTPVPTKPSASGSTGATPAARTTPAGATTPSTQSAPSADFSADPVQGPLGTVIHFKDESTGTITAWLWDFGDGTTSTERNPSHAYRTQEWEQQREQRGEPVKEFFTVTLKVTGTNGSDTIQKKDYIWISEACTC